MSIYLRQGKHTKTDRFEFCISEHLLHQDWVDNLNTCSIWLVFEDNKFACCSDLPTFKDARIRFKVMAVINAEIERIEKKLNEPLAVTAEYVAVKKGAM